MRYVIRPGNEYPNWELFEIASAKRVESLGLDIDEREIYVCTVHGANARDARECAEHVIKWRTQKSLEFEA